MKALFRNNSGTWFSMAKHVYDGQNIVLEVGDKIEHEFPNKEISYYEQFIPLGIEIVILDSSEMEGEVVGGEDIPGKDGVDGATFIPSIDEEGNLSWSNNKGLENPPTINIKGLKGDKGDKGEKGLKGDKGEQGIQGEQGPQGLKGDKGDKGDKGEQGEKGDKGDSYDDTELRAMIEELQAKHNEEI